MTILTGTRLESREVLVDAETGRELTQEQKAQAWILDYRARTGEWPMLKEITGACGVGKGTASRARVTAKAA